MSVYWWVLVFIETLLSLGIMSTYLSRRDSKRIEYRRGKDHMPLKKALVILPIRGVDYGLSENLEAIKNQEGTTFDLIAVVDSEDDPSVPYLRAANIGYIIANASCTGCSGKVRAIYSALVSMEGYDYYVVADSDIRPGREWLSNLLAPLSDQEVGVSTTFPIFMPEGGFWSKMKMFWGLVGQSMMESKLTRFVWGGSMAFRSEMLDEESLSLFAGSVSDDIAILRIMKSKGLKIAYVEDARPNIYSNENFRAFLEWSNRQTALSIYSSTRTFTFGMIYYGVSIYLIISSILFSVFVNPIFAIFLFPYILNSFVSLRRVPVKTWYFLALTLLLPFVYVYNLVSGMSTKEITWRGRVYTLTRRSANQH